MTAWISSSARIKIAFLPTHFRMSTSDINYYSRVKGGEAEGRSVCRNIFLPFSPWLLHFNARFAEQRISIRADLRGLEDEVKLKPLINSGAKDGPSFDLLRLCHPATVSKFRFLKGNATIQLWSHSLLIRL